MGLACAKLASKTLSGYSIRSVNACKNELCKLKNLILIRTLDIYPIFSEYEEYNCHGKGGLMSQYGTLLTALGISAIVCLTSCKHEEPAAQTDAVNEVEKTLRIAISDDPSTLDPHQARELITMRVSTMLFEGLTRTGAQGYAVPALASEVKLSDDQKTYTFTLKESKWSDGTPLTAHDFVRSWKRVLTPDFPAPYANHLFLIKGAQEAKEGRASVDDIAIYASNNHTFVVELTKPVPYFLEIVSEPVSFPVPKNWNSDSSKETIVSNGPYNVKSWRRHSALTLKKSNNYWAQDSVKMQNVALNIQDDNTSLALFERGELDWIGSPLSTIPTDALPTLKKEGKLFVTPASATYFFRFNTAHSIFKHPKARQALAYALDRQTIIEHVLQGKQEPATGLVPPVMGLRDRPYFRDHNIIAARRLFSEALQDLGMSRLTLRPITLSYASNNAIMHKIVQVVQQQWKHAFGIEVALHNSEGKVLLEDLQTQTYDIAMGSWFADINDPISFLEIFSSKANGTNNTGWEHPRYSELLEQSNLAADPKERKSLLREAEHLLIDEMPIAPLFFSTYSYMKRSELSGIRIMESGYIDFSSATFSNKPSTAE
jgi:oligopeptide transport system substrate-binding protein